MYQRWLRDTVIIATRETSANDGFSSIVPLIILGLCIHGYRRTGLPWRRRVAQAAWVRGAVMLAAGLIIHMVAWWTYFSLLDAAALAAILLGILWIIGGRRAVRGYGLAAAMVFFATAWPVGWRQFASVQLQTVVSHISAVCLQFSGLAVVHEGNFLYLPGQTMEVAEGCSGIRQLDTFIALSFLLAGLHRLRTASAAVLVLSAVPIAVIGNCVRVLVTAGLLVYGDPKLAAGVFHTLEGLALVAISSIFILLLARRLKSRETAAHSSQPEPASSLKARLASNLSRLPGRSSSLARSGGQGE